jgi:hypothetical protein
LVNKLRVGVVAATVVWPDAAARSRRGAAIGKSLVELPTASSNSYPMS